MIVVHILISVISDFQRVFCSYDPQHAIRRLHLMLSLDLFVS